MSSNNSHKKQPYRSPKYPDLNKSHLRVKARDKESTEPLSDNTRASRDGKIQTYFRDIERHLLEFIAEADIIVGCVAWLTNKNILKALSLKEGISIIVQKEDFLRPDIYRSSNWKEEIRNMYSLLKGDLDPFLVGGAGDGIMSAVTSKFEKIEAVRCVGYHNTEHDAAFPRMHNKFIVACTNARIGDDNNLWPEPYAVWTGSYNFTANASRSLENAVVIRDKMIAWSYFEEYSQIAILSEPLDWTSDWVTPQWHLGP